MAYDPWAYTSPCGVLNGGVLISEVGLLATLRLRGTSGRDGCQVQKKKKKKCIVGLFWWTHFQHGGKFVPKNSPTMRFDNHLDPIFCATSKWRITGRDTGVQEQAIAVLVKITFALIYWFLN